MKLSLALQESIYDCKIQITDSQGSRYYYVNALCEEGMSAVPITVDVFDSAFDMTLIPVMPQIDPLLDEIEENSWKEKIAKKVAGFLVSSVEKAVLRVGCRYRIDQVQDGDKLDIALQAYVFGTFDRFGLLELFPMMYMFFEISHFNRRFSLTDAFETNRKEVLKTARGVTLVGGFGIDFLLTLLFSYPIQIGRVKHLTKNRKIRKTLIKFNRLSDTERQRFLEKQEEFTERGM